MDNARNCSNENEMVAAEIMKIMAPGRRSNLKDGHVEVVEVIQRTSGDHA